MSISTVARLDRLSIENVSTEKWKSYNCMLAEIFFGSRSLTISTSGSVPEESVLCGTLLSGFIGQWYC